MMNLNDRLIQARKNKEAILAANFYNAETLIAIARAAQLANRPVIFQLTKGTIDYLGLNMAMAMARSVISDYQLEAWIHLDHGGSLELVQQCLDAGFDSVMIDGSERPFDENIALAMKAVKMAEPYHASVEAELGYIPKLGQDKSMLESTSAEQAKLFADSSGVNFLAVAIGNSHGFYKAPPKIDLVRLEEIAELVKIPLVLHGSSGISDEVLRETIQRGISKINLATETKNAFMKELKNVLINSEDIDLRNTFPKAIAKVVSLISNKLNLINTH
jgi:fructose-bisphosphate aldolase class II/tagatose 1,6-diphosphate aldolase GatY/KbaY